MSLTLKKQLRLFKNSTKRNVIINLVEIYEFTRKRRFHFNENNVPEIQFMDILKTINVYFYIMIKDKLYKCLVRCKVNGLVKLPGDIYPTCYIEPINYTKIKPVPENRLYKKFKNIKRIYRGTEKYISFDNLINSINTNENPLKYGRIFEIIEYGEKNEKYDTWKLIFEKEVLFHHRCHDVYHKLFLLYQIRNKKGQYIFSNWFLINRIYHYGLKNSSLVSLLNKEHICHGIKNGFIHY